MAAIHVSTSEFRSNQASILDLVDKGRTVVLRRGRKSYTITPVREDDMDFTPQMYAKIDKALEQVKNGDVFKMEESESLESFLHRIDVEE